MEFKTQYSPRLRIAAEAGTPIHITFEPFYDDKGVLDLKEAGKVNQYLEIQSHADSVDINLLLARYRAGEKDVLNQVQGFYSDVTGMPKTYAGMLNTLIAGENAFMKLPVDIRQKFNHSFTQFMAEFGSDSWNEKLQYEPTKVDMNLVNQIADDAVKTEVKTDEP